MNYIALALFVSLPFCGYSQKVNDTYAIRNERDLKKYAFSIYLGYQISLTDTNYLHGDIDPFVTEFFNNSNYSYQALLIIQEFSEKMAKKEYRSAGIKKCYCYELSLNFYNSRKLDSVVRSVRKYLEPPKKK